MVEGTWSERNLGGEAESDGEETDENEETTEDNTSENVGGNDPEANKKLAEITMAEQIRETYNLKITIPKILEGLHTNQFFFMDITDNFYETNYPTIISTIADKKFARFAGFEKGRFFVEAVKEYGGMDGWKMEITLNPIPPSLAVWSKMQQEATKALMNAILYESGGTGSGGGLTTMSGSDCTETYDIATTSYNISETANHLIGDSSANYATGTANMDGKTALLTIFDRFSYNYYMDNRTCPQEMYNEGTISGNCADISRLCMCVGQVHGMTIGIHHMSGHYYNLVEVDGQTYRFDCCCKSTGSYRGEQTNNLNRNGGPWC